MGWTETIKEDIITSADLVQLLLVAVEYQTLYSNAGTSWSMTHLNTNHNMYHQFIHLKF